MFNQKEVGMNNLRIKSSRQQRAIAILLKKPVTVKDLGPIIGALNPRQVISELRNQGFYGIIETRRFSVIDQDGRLCRPGEYYIPEQLKQKVENTLNEHRAQEYQSKASRIQLKSKNNQESN